MFDYERYLRLEKFPHIWCSGCGHGIVFKALLRAIGALDLDKDKICLISGIGCSSRTPGYADFNTLHTTHGRALTFATGIKLSRPDLHVIVISGDGDCTAIGGNHFIHAARRNIDITLIVENNFIYGMTGGQVSPTAPIGSYASTAPYGVIDQPFDISGLAQAAGAAFVARSTVYHAKHLSDLIQQGLGKKGFAVIESLSPCPTSFGRKNRLRTPVEMLKWLRDNTLPIAAAAKLPPEKIRGKITRGVLWDVDKPEYTEQYRAVIERARGEQGMA
ncbi:2-oxoacid:ferredoxin oxidoreductase subunit beta [bacterium]|nr:2-oxoacid:ferredoxin oxidoreductase subunit beta [candidate division CSSED10-310 bacterium]